MKTRESGMPEEPQWSAFFKPEHVLRSLGLTPTHRNVVDLGCGYGTFTIPAARVVAGSVHAVDIEPEMAEATAAKAAAAGLTNVVVHLRDFVDLGLGLPDLSVDFAMLFNILHAHERGAMLRECRRVMAPGGILAVMHWNYDPTTPRGPSMAIRLTPEQCRQYVSADGFRPLTGRIDLPPYHYGYSFQRD